MEFERLLRVGDRSQGAVRADVYWLFALTLLLVATGIGLRDAWPADEPRFALIARDMALTGEWLIPQIGGDFYADKPPLFFWIVGGLYWLTGSLRFALLAPGLLSALTCVLLIYDLGRRLWDREAGFAAGLGLLATVQFIWQMRQGQIDATLCLFTTLGFYAFARHLLLGPAWSWWFVGWAAAGFGIITKGVGFLPVLALIPYALARVRGWIPAAPLRSDWRWWIGPLVMIAAIGMWLAPMLIAAAFDPRIAAYRDEILFRQTIDRYAGAWHHQKPFWYFIVQVIPILWLPLIAVAPWLWRHWVERLRARDLRTWLPLGWVLLVVLFFSFSSGKRGVYVLPAAPAFVLACAPFLREVFARRGPNRVLFGLACLLAALTAAAGVFMLIEPSERENFSASYDIDPLGPLFTIAALSALVCALARPRRGFAAFVGVLAAVLLVVSFWVNPGMNEGRSAARFVQGVEARTRGVAEFAMASYKEQYLLQLTRPAVNFGHARWREFQQEAYDAAAWLNAGSNRVLLADARARELCFKTAHAEEVGRANRMQWYLLRGAADPGCAAKGRLDAARLYSPPQRARTS